jgi:hypothetical protein
MEEKFSTKVHIHHTSKGTGKIEIAYLSLDQFNQILNLLDISAD